MAKWQLTAAHYLNLAQTDEWEYKETDRNTGRQNRKVFKVPTYLDEGTIVCQGGGDGYEFLGEPTPDMEPLDDEARAISDKLRPKWVHPIEGMDRKPVWDPQTLAMMEAFAKATGQAQASQTNISADDFKALQEQVAMLAKQNTELTAKLASRKV